MILPGLEKCGNDPAAYERGKWENDWRKHGCMADWGNLVSHATGLGLPEALKLHSEVLKRNLPEVKGFPVEVAPPPPAVPEEGFAEEADDRSSPNYSEEQLALRFAEQHIGRLQYVAPWGKWLIWDGRMWAVDDTWRVFNLARVLCRTTARDSNELDDSDKRKIASVNTVGHVGVRLAQADRLHAATVDQWDADPWLLNTPAGVVDLKTRKTSEP